MKFSGLKKFAQGVAAQANPFDGGQTFQSVQNQQFKDASQIPQGYNFNAQPVSLQGLQNAQQNGAIQRVDGFGGTYPSLPPGLQMNNPEPLILGRGEIMPGQSMNFAYGQNEYPEQLPYMNYR